MGRNGQDSWYAKFKCMKLITHPQFAGPDSGFDIAIILIELVNMKDINSETLQSDCFRMFVNPILKILFEKCEIDIGGYPAVPVDVRGFYMHMNGSIHSIV